MLTIQSYAELNKPERVLPFVIDLYGGIELCTAQVVQLWLVDIHGHHFILSSFNLIWSAIPDTRVLFEVIIVMITCSDNVHMHSHHLLSSFRTLSIMYCHVILLLTCDMIAHACMHTHTNTHCATHTYFM